MKRTVLFISLSLFGTGLLSAEDGNSLPILSGKGQAVFSLRAGEAVDIAIPGLRLEADTGSLTHDLTLSVALPERHQTAPMPSVMENVTGDFTEAFRLLPGGVHFSTPARITLSYDPARLPAGTRPEDIRTCFFDSTTLAWTPLERVMLDTAARTVTSLTDHFTDFANAVIRVPDMPETSAFVPTVMQDLPDVNPLQGIPMVAPPTPNNRGTAELTYPIQLPAGRQGMQPVLDLRYSSAGGNGLLGVGWDIPLPAVTIDTRWGVPRYDPALETEAYLVDGEPVLLRDNSGAALPLPHQDSLFRPRVTQPVRFYARDRRNQNKIVRHGTNPTNYWWSSTDRNGTVTFYGRLLNPKFPDQFDGIDENSVIRTSNGCIAYWAATAVMDVDGNYMLYSNMKSGNRIYPQEIVYTGHPDYNGGPVNPAYRVSFGYIYRSDVTTNGRLGLLQTDDQLLCHIIAQYMPPRPNGIPEPEYFENITAWYMEYDAPASYNLYKSRLSCVYRLDSVPDLKLEDVCSINSIMMGDVNRWHNVTEAVLQRIRRDNPEFYHDAAELSNHAYGAQGVPGSKTEFHYTDAPAPSQWFTGSPVTIGTGRVSEGGSLSVGAGATATVGPGADILTTLFSAGVNFDYTWNNGWLSRMLIDLNGDGLTDLVYIDDGDVWFRALTGSGGNYHFENTPHRLLSAPRLTNDNTHTYTAGAQVSLGHNFSYSCPVSDTYTDTYFADVNADGLPDFVHDGHVYINRRGASGIPVFEDQDAEYTLANSAECRRITHSGEVHPDLECRLREVLVERVPLSRYYPSASDPYLSDELQKIEDKSDEEKELTYSDNEKLPIIKALDMPNAPAKGTTDSGYKASRGDGAPLTDDSLIIRIEGDYVCTYRLETVCDRDTLLPEIEVVRVWVAPHEGTVSVDSRFRLLEDMSVSRQKSRRADGVIYAMQHLSGVTASGGRLHAQQSVTPLRDTVSASDYVLHRRQVNDLTVQAGDILFFRLQSGDNSLYDSADWIQTIAYSDTVGTPESYASDSDYLCTGDKSFGTDASGGTACVRIDYVNSTGMPLTLECRQDGVTDTTIVLLADGQEHTALYTRMPTDSTLFSFYVPSPAVEPVWSQLHVSPLVVWHSTFTGVGGTSVQDSIL